jgi:hypothetical protein
MKELDFRAGEHIGNACARLAREAPAWVDFNGVRIEAVPGDTAGDLESRWSAEMNRKRREYEASDLYKQRQAEAKVREAEEQARQRVTRLLVAESGVREKYPWTDAMGEISGFGGGYEQACRDMVYAGLAWCKGNPNADLSTYTTDDAKSLDKALLYAEPGCSGAMHGAAMNAVAFIAKQGWPEYVRRMTKRSAEQPSEEQSK